MSTYSKMFIVSVIMFIAGIICLYTDKIYISAIHWGGAICALFAAIYSMISEKK